MYCCGNICGQKTEMPSCLHYSWIKWRLPLQILLVLLMFAEMDIPGFSKAMCQNGTSSDRFGSAFLTKTTSPCGWTLNATDNNSMLTIHIIFNNGFGGNMYIVLPNGQHFKKATGKPWLHDNPWCGMFIAKNHTNCRLNATYSSSCKAVKEYSETWPPAIAVTALTGNAKILLVYSFVQCPTLPPTTTSYVTITPSMTSNHASSATQNKEPVSDSVTTQLSSGISTEVTDPGMSGNSTQNKEPVSDSVTTQLSSRISTEVTDPAREITQQGSTGAVSTALPNSDKASAAVISVLAVLLLCACVALVVLAVKCRNLQLRVSIAQVRLAGDFPNEPAANLYSMADSEREMVDNVLYGATEMAGEKQTVYNELYASTSAGCD